MQTPAKNIARLFGGPERLAEVCEVTRTTVYQWTSKKGWTGGRIPEAHWDAVTFHAKRLGIENRVGITFGPEVYREPFWEARFVDKSGVVHVLSVRGTEGGGNYSLDGDSVPRAAGSGR